MTPQYLQHCLPSFRTSSIRTNKVNEFQEIMCNTSRYKNSFFPDSVKSWNNIRSVFCSSSSIGIFKKKIFALVRPKSKPVYGINDHIGLEYVFQFRVGLSPLKFHKKRHNFADTANDLCDCGLASEDLAHFLFYCPLYTIPRITLSTAVSNILHLNNLQHLSHNVEIHIFGHHLLNPIDNKIILSSTITFIKDTQRFLWYLTFP